MWLSPYFTSSSTSNHLMRVTPLATFHDTTSNNSGDKKAGGTGSTGHAASIMPIWRGRGGRSVPEGLGRTIGAGTCRLRLAPMDASAPVLAELSAREGDCFNRYYG